MTSTASTTLAQVAVQLADAPDPVLVERAVVLLTDFLAVTIGGSTEPSSRAVRDAALALGASGPATVIGTALRLAAPGAALANGAAAHALEMDDTFQPGSIHLGAPILPAALAAAELHATSGRRLLGAVAGGYEVAGRLATALDPAAHYARGFHPTGTCGTFGAAAAAAIVQGLDADGVARALGIAGSQAAGSMAFLDDGAWTKRLHPGWAALAGLHAAALAGAGFRAPAAIVDGRFGTLHAYTDAPRPERLVEVADPVILRTSVKPHACCRYMQGPIDAVLALRARHALRPDDVTAVEVGLVAAAFPIVCEPAAAKHQPASVVDAQFSLPFGVAVALVDGAAAPEQFAAPRWTDSAVRRVMDRVIPRHDPALDARYPDVWPTWVRIDTADGRSLVERVDHPTGDPERFVTTADLHEKLRRLAGRVLDARAIDVLLERLAAFPADADCARLLAATTVT
jgi:2-methylcitrate dehydratase PrpD